VSLISTAVDTGADEEDYDPVSLEERIDGDRCVYSLLSSLFSSPLSLSSIYSNV
jgi:hypothetical protein